MANYTPNLNLRKPLTTEKYDVVADLNDTKDKIDNHAGAVNAQLAEMVRYEYVNVKHFNTIQEAIDSITSNNQVLLFPDGVYVFNETLLLNTNAKRMLGIGNVELRYEGPVGSYAINTVEETGFSHGFMKNIRLFLPETRDRNGINFTYMRYSYFEDIFVFYGNIGLNVSQSFGSHFSRCKEYFCNVGFQMLNDSNGISISSNLAESCDVGVLMTGTNVTFTNGCIFEKNIKAIVVRDIRMCDVSSCYFEQNDVDISYSELFSNSRQFVVSKCSFVGDGVNIIEMTTSSTNNEMQIDFHDNLLSKNLSGHVINKTTTSVDKITYYNNKERNLTSLGILGGSFRYSNMKSDGTIKHVPVLENSWVEDVNNPIEIYVDMEGYFNLKGKITSGAGTTILSDLPPYMQPLSNIKFNVAHGAWSALTALAQLTVKTDGSIAVYGATDDVYLNGVKWKR